MNRTLLAFFLALGAHGLIFTLGDVWLPKPPTIKKPVRQVTVSLARAPRTKSVSNLSTASSLKEKKPRAKPKAVIPLKKTIKKPPKKIVRPRPVKKRPVAPKKPKPVKLEKPKPVVPEKPKPAELEQDVLPVDPAPAKAAEPTPEESSEPEFTGETPTLAHTEPQPIAPGHGAPDLSADSILLAKDPIVEARPLYRENPAPKYPVSARRRGMEGKVVLDILVDREGRVGNVSVAVSSGYAILDRAALSTVKDWLFEPGSRGGHAVDMKVQVPIQFRLN